MSYCQKGTIPYPVHIYIYLTVFGDDSYSLFCCFLKNHAKKGDNLKTICIVICYFCVRVKN